MLFFLSTNDVSFNAKTTDPWFSATTPGGFYNDPNGTDMSVVQIPYYIGDTPANPIGCISRVQYCNPNLPPNSRCEPLRNSYNWTDATLSLWPGRTATNLLPWLWSVMDFTRLNLWDLVEELGTSILLARQSLALNVQAPLPDNQWQLEVESWHAASLVSLQAGFVNSAVGTRDPLLDDKATRPQDAESQNACINQVCAREHNGKSTSYLTTDMRSENRQHSVLILQRARPSFNSRSRHAHHRCRPRA